MARLPAALGSGEVGDEYVHGCRLQAESCEARTGLGFRHRAGKARGEGLTGQPRAAARRLSSRSGLTATG